MIFFASTTSAAFYAWEAGMPFWVPAGSVDTDLSFLSLLELYGTEIAER